jgi:hypothetical protein
MKHNSTSSITVSMEFRSALKLHKLPAYRIAQLASLNPVVLSKLINGIEPIKPNDERILAVARVLKLKAKDCFSEIKASR